MTLAGTRPPTVDEWDNEMVLCNLFAETIAKEYVGWCWDCQVEPVDKWRNNNFVLPYPAIFKRMKK